MQYPAGGTTGYCVFRGMEQGGVSIQGMGDPYICTMGTRCLTLLPYFTMY